MCTNTKQKLRGRLLKLCSSKPKSNPNSRKSSCEWNTLYVFLLVSLDIWNSLAFQSAVLTCCLKQGRCHHVLYQYCFTLSQNYDRVVILKWCIKICAWWSANWYLVPILYLLCDCIMQVIYLCYSYPVYKVIHLFWGLIRQNSEVLFEHEECSATTETQMHASV